MGSTQRHYPAAKPGGTRSEVPASSPFGHGQEQSARNRLGDCAIKTSGAPDKGILGPSTVSQDFPLLDDKKCVSVRLKYPDKK